MTKHETVRKPLQGVFLLMHRVCLPSCQRCRDFEASVIGFQRIADSQSSAFKETLSRTKRRTKTRTGTRRKTKRRRQQFCHSATLIQNKSFPQGRKSNKIQSLFPGWNHGPLLWAPTSFLFLSPNYGPEIGLAGLHQVYHNECPRIKAQGPW